MSHYIDIQLRPDPEFPAHLLLSALYAKLHRALVNLSSDSIGVAFPKYAISPSSLGDVIRLLGSEAELGRLISQNWLTGMSEHCRVSSPRPIPSGARFRELRRAQVKTSPERIRRRQMKRHGLSEAQAREKVPDDVAKRLKLPFVQIASKSTGQTFRIYLRLGSELADAKSGSFNAYGLSTTATIPWF